MPDYELPGMWEAADFSGGETDQPVQKSASETARYIVDMSSATSIQANMVLEALIDFGAQGRNTIDVSYIRRVSHHLRKFQ